RDEHGLEGVGRTGGPVERVLPVARPGTGPGIGLGTEGKGEGPERGAEQRGFRETKGASFHRSGFAMNRNSKQDWLRASIVWPVWVFVARILSRYNAEPRDKNRTI